MKVACFVLFLFVSSQFYFQELIRGGARVDMRDAIANTALACAISRNYEACAEFLFDCGATIAAARKSPALHFHKLPLWMRNIVTKRRNLKRSLKTFIGVLRRRFTVPFIATQHIGNHIPNDIVKILSSMVWETRLDSKWIAAVAPPVKKVRKCKHKCSDKTTCSHPCCKR